MARKLTHYIAPDVCDEVEHCMHSFEKNVKKNLAEKITVCIEDSIKVAFKEHASALAVCGANVAEKESQRSKHALYQSNNNVPFVSLFLKIFTTVFSFYFLYILPIYIS